MKPRVTPKPAPKLAPKPTPTSSLATVKKHKPKPPPKPYHHGNLRESLLAAADVVLAKHGAAGITLRDVAKTAGVSHAAPYHHFASLNELLAAVSERGFVTLAEAMAKPTTLADTRERLLQICEAYVCCARANPAQFRLMFGPLLAVKRDYPAMQIASERAFGILLAAACSHDPNNGPELALCGWSLAHGLSNLLIDGAFDQLPMQVPAANLLARRLAERIFEQANPVPSNSEPR
jgi:AcrR family transcriptional regulator